jgi:cytochrome c oxidase cbb3-type subunit 1
MHPYYIVRTLGGAFFLLGAVIMAYNLWRTIADAKPVEVEIPEPASAH